MAAEQGARNLGCGTTWFGTCSPRHSHRGSVFRGGGVAKCRKKRATLRPKGAFAPAPANLSDIWEVRRLNHRCRARAAEPGRRNQGRGTRAAELGAVEPGLWNHVARNLSAATLAPWFRLSGHGVAKCRRKRATLRPKGAFAPAPANFSDIWGVRRLKQVARAVHEGHGGRCDIPPKAIMASKLALALHECQLRT